MVMPDSTSPKEIKYVQKDLNEASEKAFFHERIDNYWNKVCREVLESTSPAHFKTKEHKHLSGTVWIQLTLL